MRRYYDRENDRLVYLGSGSDDAAWDARWSSTDLRAAIRSESPTQGQRRVLDVTRRHLPEGSRVLDGGCGVGDKVHVLQAHGYEAYGIDWAPQTVRAVNACAPELRITRQDVRHTEFPDGFFDGYWSLGVIEHFFDGYEDILGEIARVLRPGGILFLTVPSLSPLRRAKARAGLYPLHTAGRNGTESFYQFALAPGEVARTIRDHGFELLESQGVNGIKGLIDEVPLLSVPLKVLFKVAYRPTERLTRVFAHHMSLFVFRKAA